MAARRAPGLVTVAGVLLLGGSLAATYWWSNRPGVEPAAPIPPDQLDVYCSGRVDAAGQVIPLEPTQPGRVVAVFVAEGAVVKIDDPLIGLDDTAAEARLIQADAAVEGAELELIQAKRSVERFPTQKEARAAVVNAAAARAEAARKALQQRRSQQAVTPTGPAELAAAEAEVRAVEQLEAGERAHFEDFEKLPAELDLRVRLATVRKRVAESDRAYAATAKRECVVRAPGPGTVLRLQATIGGIVSPGTPAPPVVFAPAGPYVVRAEVDQESLGRVAVGMAVEVRDENRPAGPVWTGTVTSVAGWVAQRRALVLEPGEISDVRTVECVVGLAAGGDPLWIGQRMRVRILRPAGGPDPVLAGPGN